MAWQAKLTALFPSDTKVVATFDYADDAAPTVLLAREQFAFDPTWSAADMQKEVQSRGAQLRTAKNRADALVAQFPVGTTIIAIP